MENKKTRTELRKDFNPLQIIIDNQPLSCWLKDKDGYYLAVNNAFADYSDASKEYIIGKNDFELYSQEEATIYVTSDQAIDTCRRQKW
ncbi:MAG: PAS domain-containing protein [Peptostreptococcaceae bacterium]|nr:PAS domain-containing protein [Peptostreptococcaceae bacterium]